MRKVVAGAFWWGVYQALTGASGASLVDSETGAYASLFTPLLTPSMTISPYKARDQYPARRKPLFCFLCVERTPATRYDTLIHVDTSFSFLRVIPTTRGFFILPAPLMLPYRYVPAFIPTMRIDLMNTQIRITGNSQGGIFPPSTALPAILAACFMTFIDSLQS